MDFYLQSFKKNVSIKEVPNNVILVVELKEMIEENGQIILRLEYDGKILNQFRIRRKYVRKRWIIKN